MKTIAAVAFGEDLLTTNEILVAGFFVSAIVFALGATGVDADGNVGGRAGHASGLGDVIGAETGFVLAVYASNDASRARKMTGVDGLLVTIVAFRGVSIAACAPEYPPGVDDGGRGRGRVGGDHGSQG